MSNWARSTIIISFQLKFYQWNAQVGEDIYQQNIPPKNKKSLWIRFGRFGWLNSFSGFKIFRSFLFFCTIFPFIRQSWAPKAQRWNQNIQSHVHFPKVIFSFDSVGVKAMANFSEANWHCRKKVKLTLLFLMFVVHYKLRKLKTGHTTPMYTIGSFGILKCHYQTRSPGFVFQIKPAIKQTELADGW